MKNLWIGVLFVRLAVCQFSIPQSTAAIAGQPLPSLVQQVTGSGNCAGGSTNTYTCTLGSNPTVGHVLYLIAFSEGSSVTSGFVGTPSSTGATWARVGSSFQNASSPGPTMYETWCATLSGSTGSTVTLSLSASVSAADGVVAEVSGGTCTVDGSMQTTAFNSNTVAQTPSISTSNANDFILALGTAATQNFTSGPTNSFTAFSRQRLGFGFGYLITSATGSYSTSWTASSSTTMVAFITAFQN